MMDIRIGDFILTKTMGIHEIAKVHEVTKFNDDIWALACYIGTTEAYHVHRTHIVTVLPARNTRVEVRGDSIPGGITGRIGEPSKSMWTIITDEHKQGMGWAWEALISGAITITRFEELDPPEITSSKNIASWCRERLMSSLDLPPESSAEDVITRIKAIKAELDVAKTEINRLKELDSLTTCKADDFKRERDAARAEIRELKDRIQCLKSVRDSLSSGRITIMTDVQDADDI